jgi:hypothetical protein
VPSRVTSPRVSRRREKTLRRRRPDVESLQTNSRRWHVFLCFCVVLLCFCSAPAQGFRLCCTIFCKACHGPRTMFEMVAIVFCLDHHMNHWPKQCMCTWKLLLLSGELWNRRKIEIKRMVSIASDVHITQWVLLHSCDWVYLHNWTTTTNTSANTIHTQRTHITFSKRTTSWSFPWFPRALLATTLPIRPA